MFVARHIGLVVLIHLGMLHAQGSSSNLHCLLLGDFGPFDVARWRREEWLQQLPRLHNRVCKYVSCDPLDTVDHLDPLDP